ncbi:hypothetical protein [Vagococcus hydrophili]|uniref:Uncharacterized protein n=1 Tax=Vagococcus hydrophili TaxID=2714947 RepID=A0A6G8AR79_9ENTE|nr:hypothetical protein [Vagococcus hydrophili]QIL47588.1 hypothetical protein G7082_03065 [Vagococcus hydrophili]
MNSFYLLMLLVLIIVVTAIFLTYYMYQLVLIDATSRKIAKPKFWAFLAASSQNGSGLPIYLFKRKGTLSYLSEIEKISVLRIKKKICALLLFDLVVFILAVWIL